MPPFRPGWYLTNPSTRTFQYFETPTKVMAQGHFEGKDKQIFDWGSREKSVPGKWSEDLKPLDNAPAGDEWDNPKNSNAKATAGSTTSTTSQNTSAVGGNASAPFNGNKTTGFLYTGVEAPGTSSTSSTPSEGPSSEEPNDALKALLEAEKERQEVPWYQRAWNKTTSVVGGIGKSIGAAWSDPGQAGIGFLKGVGNTPGDLWNLVVMAGKSPIPGDVMDKQAISLANEGKIAEANALANQAREYREFGTVGDLFTLDNPAQKGGSLATILIPVGTVVKGASTLAKTGKAVSTVSKVEDISKAVKAVATEEKIAQGLSTADKVEDLSKAQGVVKGEELASKGSVVNSGAAVSKGNIVSKISYQKQQRHIKNTAEWIKRGKGGYLLKEQDAQKVLDAFHSGEAKVLGTTSQGHIVVEYKGITGFNNNPAAGFIDQPTNVFMIKGSTSPSIVPTNPNWTP